MNPETFPCRASAISRLGRFFALSFYPLVSLGLLFISAYMSFEVVTSNGYTVEQLYVLGLVIMAAVVLSCLFFYMSKNYYLMETRRISMDDHGFVISDMKNRRYMWQEIEDICVIAYAADAANEIYQKQICIFLVPIDNVALKKLRNGYSYGAFNRDKYILMDYSPLILNKLATYINRSIVDLIPKQMKL